MTRWNKILIPCAAFLLTITACQIETEVGEHEFVSTSDNPHLGSASPGKPAAAVDIRYRILEEAIIGQPLTVELQFVTPANTRTKEVHYRSVDSSTLVVAQSEARIAGLSSNDNDSPDTHTITVIPQVEGRSYFVVSVTVDTATGVTTKHTSIPIQVGTGGPRLEMNGELVTNEDGSLIISMPAKEN